MWHHDLFGHAEQQTQARIYYMTMNALVQRSFARSPIDCQHIYNVQQTTWRPYQCIVRRVT